MIYLMLNSIALDPNRWTAEKIPRFRLPDLIESISEFGFRYLEVWQQHILLEDIESVSATKSAADSVGVTFPVIGAYPKLHLTGEDRQEEFDKFELIVERARILGAQILKIFVGSKGTEQLSPAEYERSIAFLNQLVNAANERELKVTGEMHQKTLFDSTSSALQVLKSITSGGFRICYQPYDFKSTDMALRDYLTVAANTSHVHFQGKRNGHFEHLENSDIDYARLIQELVRQGFEGFIGIEFVKDCVVEDASDFRLMQVLGNARRDKRYIADILEQHGAAYSG